MEEINWIYRSDPSLPNSENHFVIKVGNDENSDGYYQTLRMFRNGQCVLEEKDGGEPEDQSFYRDWKWVKEAIQAAYEYGLEDGRKSITSSKS